MLIFEEKNETHVATLNAKKSRNLQATSKPHTYQYSTSATTNEMHNCKQVTIPILRIQTCDRYNLSKKKNYVQQFALIIFFICFCFCFFFFILYKKSEGRKI
jgi:hypothetical protein